MPELGCGENRAFIYDQGGERMIGELTTVVQIQHGRVLSDVSEATIVVGGPRDEACCELLGKIEPWRHELVIFRDGKRVWEGPVRNVHSKTGQVVIDARDVLAWADRSIHEGIDDNLAQPPTFIWASDLASAFLHFDPNVLAFRRFPFGLAGDVPIHHPVKQYSGYYGDDMRALGKLGVNYTTNGRSIIAWPERIPLGRTLPLETGKDYLGEVEFVVSGDDYVSEALSQDINGVATSSTATTRAYYGRVQKIVDPQGALGVSELSYLTKLEVDRNGARMPVVLVPPSDAPLSPKAPVTYEDLVCGMSVPLSVTDPLCRKFDAEMILNEVTCNQGASGETVSIGLTMVGVDGAAGTTKAWTMRKRLALQQEINRLHDAWERSHP